MEHKIEQWRHLTRRMRGTIAYGDPFKGLAEKGILVRELIKKGRRGPVYRAKHATSSLEFAVKVISKLELRPRSLRALRAESEVRSDITHENLMRYYGSLEDDSHLFLISELCDGNILMYLKRTRTTLFSEREAIRMFSDMLHAVAALHSRGVSHCNLKADSFYIHEGRLKLGHFGSLYCRPPGASHYVSEWKGSFAYMAPEVLLRRRHIPELADAWSLGVTLYGMLTIRVPFPKPMAKLNVRNVLKTKQMLRVSVKIRNLIQGLLHKDPAKRFTIQRAIDQLETRLFF